MLSFPHLKSSAAPAGGSPRAVAALEYFPLQWTDLTLPVPGLLTQDSLPRILTHITSIEYEEEIILIYSEQ